MTCCDEYCSNYGCNQGRNCPARVAKIKQRMAAADPLPPSTWREKLCKYSRWALIAAIIAAYLQPLAYFVLRE